MKIIEYSGKEPQIIPPSEIKQILEIISRQLSVLEKLATNVVLIPANTKLTEVKE